MKYEIIFICFLMVLLSLNFVSAFDWNTNIIAYWQMENQSELINPSYYNLTAFNLDYGSPLFLTGKLGLGSYHTIATNVGWKVTKYSDDLNFNSTGVNFSISFWINETATYTQILMEHYIAKGWMIKMASSKITITGMTGADVDVPAIDNLNLNTWQHIVVIANSSNVCIFINGTINKCADRGGYAITGVHDHNLLFGIYYPGSYPLNGGLDEIGIWKRALNTSEVLELYNGGNGLPYGGSAMEASNININLTYPLNNALISTTSINLTGNFSIIGTGNNYTWRNATFYTWKSGAIYNQSFIYLSENNTQNSTVITGLSIGSYQWNIYGCYANNTFSNCTWALSNLNFEIGALILAEYYNGHTYETSTENFQINISILERSSLISAFLWYDGTPYVISDISTINSQKVLKKTIDIPLNPLFTNTTKNFYWSFIFSNTGLSPQNTTTNQQNVSFINFQLCNATYLSTSINFTTKNEENPNLVITSKFHSNWNYWLGNGNTKKNYSYEDVSLGNSSFKFCIFPSIKIFNANSDIEYSSTLFPERTKYLRNATLSNITQEIELFLLNLTDSVKFFFTLTQSLSPVPDAIIIISKYDVGVGKWITIGTRKSDIAGKFIEYLELDKEYQFSISKNGEFLGIIYKTSTCSATPCGITLELTTGITDLWSGYYDIYATNVAYNLSYNPSTKNITFVFVDLTGLAQYFRLQVIKISYNQSGIIICNKTFYTTAGTIVCDLTGWTGNFRADAFISRSPEKWVDTIFAIIDAIREILGKEGLLFTLFIVITLGLIGAWNPVVGIILAALAIFFSFIIGFIAISYSAIILIFVLAIFLVIKMGKGGGV